MLVITMRPGDRTRVTTPEGRTIWLEMVRGGHDKCRIGWEADREVNIVREEVLERSQPDSMMNCPDCHGHQGLNCDRCHGVGRVSTEMIQWIEDGKKLRAKRLHGQNGHTTLENAAKLLGVDVVTLSRMERGCIAPLEAR